MGNFLTPRKKSKALDPDPIETPFEFPSPLPSWPRGGGFAEGTIDLGGLEVCQISTFTKVWAAHEGGQDNLGATFYNPSRLPPSFYMLGSYAQANNKPLFGRILVAKGGARDASNPLAKPTDFSLVWRSDPSSIKQDGDGYFWLPVAPDGYKAVGLIVTNTPDKPPVDGFRCVRDDFTEQCEGDDQPIWSHAEDHFSVYGLKPSTISTTSLGVPVGTFGAQTEGSSNNISVILSCLRNKSSSTFSSMPNLHQIQALFQAYSPVIYFHPDETYLPSSTSWFFENGGLLYRKGDPDPSPIDPNGSALPQGGSNDGQYWLDLPTNDGAKELVKKGDVSKAKAYLHVKPTLGGTFTDIAVWIYYPFNGPARAKVGVFDVKLGRIGEHVGDWEHVTLRVSNYDGRLCGVYFSEHSSGAWVDASRLEYCGDGNKFAAYSSLHGHAFYPRAGLYLQGGNGVGIRNDAGKGKDSMDTGAAFEVAAAGYLSPAVVVAEPPWLNYLREWGPKVSYDIAKELKDVERFLPKKLRRALEDFVRGLPSEILGEEGPTGPKEKANWTMDEK